MPVATAIRAYGNGTLHRQYLAHNIISMSESEVPDERVDQFIVFAAYGEVMHQFQVFEMTLWGFLTRGIKPGMSESQAFEGSPSGTGRR